MIHTNYLCVEHDISMIAKTNISSISVSFLFLFILLQPTNLTNENTPVNYSVSTEIYQFGIANILTISLQLSKLPVKQFFSKPFQNSRMGRDLCAAEIDAGANKKLVVATSHLESPTPPEMNSVGRVAQAGEALSLLNSVPNVIFGGDMNWDEISDGPFPLRGGWQDAWSVLRPEENGWTYDTRSNMMLKGNRPLWKRLDRFVCKLQDFRMVSVDMIGRDAIPGISYYNKRKELPVLPSDHYGLVLTICPM